MPTPRPRPSGGRTRQKDNKVKFAFLLGLVGLAFFYVYNEEESLPSFAGYSYVDDGNGGGGVMTARASHPSTSIRSTPTSTGTSQPKRGPKVPYQPEKATYITRDFKKVLNARDFRDSFHKDRKSGVASPRDTLSSNDMAVGRGGGNRIPVNEATHEDDDDHDDDDDDDVADDDDDASSSDDFPILPRIVSYPSSRSDRRGHLRIPYEPPPLHPRRYAPWSKGQQRRQQYLKDERYYNDDDHMAENPYADHPECVPMHEWQTASYPSCNILHSLELQQSKFVANGFFRDVWAIDRTSVVDTTEDDEEGGNTRNNNYRAEQVAVKTLRLRDSSKLDFDARNYHRHRVDAISYERLTSSPYVMNIYGYCGQSGIFEYAPDGDLSDALANDNDKNNLSKEERFKVAVEVARSVSDLHNFNGRVPAIAHSDIWHSQFVKTRRGVFALSDFNRAQFLYWNSTSNEGSCPYYYQHTNGYPFRSPEEYKYEAQTEKIDIYSMGNIFFSLLMDKWPYEELYKEKNTAVVSKLITKGKRDKLSKELLESADPIDVALRTAMEMCWEQDWKRRASARDVANYLDAEQEKLVAK
eukprot:CAMPEP_0178730000 /NCGR_PEP_ID=MMETSP0699-20121125/29279_1 /TAXON_ID=265572 /ORGANISM="Extubocellulus spinifer, Strain CCMP396" /LENGTH=582 /DNA_ID=CAMNT_0020381983 /DNA_START=93 /DNA_END=1841 /DNA_ORIENTATION=+